MSSRVTLNQVLTIVNTLENLIKQCFGPNALNIMLCTATGKLVLTSSGTTILRAVNVEHPVGKMIIDSMQSHHALTGNNSKTFIFLLKTLLQELRIEQDRMNVSLGLSIVQKWLLPEIGFDVLKLCTKVNLKNIEHVKCACQFIVYTSLQGKLNSIAIKLVTRIIIDAMFYETMDSQQILQTVRQNIDDIDLFCIENPGQPISSSLYIPGIIVQRELIPFPKIKGQLRCVLLSCDLLIESEVTIQTSTREQLTQALVWKMRFMKLLIASLREHGINLVISRQQLDKDVCSEMVSSNIYVMTSVLEEDMLRISTSTGVLPISEIDNILKKQFSNNVFTCEKCSLIALNSRRCVLLQGLSSPTGCPKPSHIVVCAPTNGMTVHLKGCVLNCLKVIRMAFDNQNLQPCDEATRTSQDILVTCPGAGAFELLLYRVMKDYIDKMTDPHIKQACCAVRNSLLCVPLTLLHNSYSCAAKRLNLAELLGGVTKSEMAIFGVDAKHGTKVVDMSTQVSFFEERSEERMLIVEPVASKLKLLYDVLDLAILLLRLDCVVSVKSLQNLKQQEDMNENSDSDEFID